MPPNAQGKRRRSTEGAQGTNKGHENAEGMAFVGVRLTAELDAEFWALVLRVIAEPAPLVDGRRAERSPHERA